MHRLNQIKTVSCDQQSEYDSTPEEEDNQLGEDQEKDSLRADVCVTPFLIVFQYPAFPREAKEMETSACRLEKESGVENYEMPVTPVNFLSRNNRFHSNELHCFYTLSSSNKKQRIISLITIAFVSFPSRVI